MELLHYQRNAFLTEGYRLVESQELHLSGSRADLMAWLGAHAHFVDRPTRYQSGFVRLGQQQPFPVADAARVWDQAHGPWDPPNNIAPGSLGQLAPYLVYNGEPANRSGMVGGVGARQSAEEPPLHPMHFMQDNQELRQRLSAMSEDVFGQPLTLDLTSNTLLLRVGTPSVPTPRLDESFALYRANLVTLPPVAQQGDGMKSFLGLLASLLTSSYPIVFIDEPEAFLHPPQAAALGRALSTLVRENRLQVILATHDRNFLTGLLEVPDVPISIVRLHRDGNLTTPYQLNSDDVRRLWTDVALRYTNVLDGLFHRLVVIAESDRDCRFYAASLDAAHEAAPLQIPPSEVLFVPSNGKQGMARLVRALEAVHTPVVASPDLDILNDETVLAGLVAQFGGSWESIAPDYRIATDPFRQPREQVYCRDVLAAITSVLEVDPDAQYDPEIRAKVFAQLRTHESPWKALKTAGDRAFIGAEATAAGYRLLDALDAIGIVTVRIGELERFAPTVEAGKGAAWLTAALEAQAHTEVAPIEHVRRLLQAGLGGLT
jgi:hypothetical protein